MSSKNVLVIGTWHLGSVVGACIAEAGHQVHLWDQDERVETAWKKGQPPVYEPGLSELAKTSWQKNLFWLQDGTSPKIWDWIVLAYDTPVNENDQIDLSVVEFGFRKALEAHVGPKTNIFITAQVPVGTSRRFRSQLLQAHPQWGGEFFYQPENLRLGTALDSFRKPDRLVVGCDGVNGEQRQAQLPKFKELVGNIPTEYQVMSLESAEMVKHAMNAFLATCVVFANSISNVCEETGADAWDVMASLKKDSRVGPKAFLRPGLGFAGATLARDLQVLRTFHKEKHTSLFEQIYDQNTQRNHWVVSQVEKALGANLQGKKAVLLGVTYKPQTSTVRRSPAIEIGQLLKDRGISCMAIDPMADVGELSAEEARTLPFTLVTDAQAAFKNADVAILVTEWPQFLELAWGDLLPTMKTPIVIDTKNHIKNLPPTTARYVPGVPSGR